MQIDKIISNSRLVIIKYEVLGNRINVLPELTNEFTLKKKLLPEITVI